MTIRPIRQSAKSSSSSSSQTSLLLILGAGWTSTFLIPLLESADVHIPYAATSTTGRASTIKFVFDPQSTDTKPYEALPDARLVLITFPLRGRGQSKLLVESYRRTHADVAASVKLVQLGSTGIFSAPQWNDADSEYDRTNERAVAEDELLALGGCVLNLAGLYGGTRDPREWLGRVARTKEEVKAKKALHMVHGRDVARAILAVYGGFTEGKRWLLADLHVYDWWDLFVEWGGGKKEEEEEEEEKRTKREEGEKEEERPYRRWVGECMMEEGVRALPRDTTSLGRVLDSRHFWAYFGIWPSHGSVRSG